MRNRCFHMYLYGWGRNTGWTYNSITDSALDSTRQKRCRCCGLPLLADPPIRKPISLTKIDEKTGNKCSPGFQFSITVREDIVDGANNIRTWNGAPLTAGTEVEVITTGEDSVATSSMLYVGKYNVQEVAVSRTAGQAINRKVYPFDIVDDGSEAQDTQVVDMDIPNPPTSLKISKTTDDGEPMAQVQFLIVNAEGTPLAAKDGSHADGVYETDSNGVIDLEYIHVGTYTNSILR